MKCAKCQTVNREDRSFCKKCGGQLLFHCQQCGFDNELQDIFCGGCGRKRSDSVTPELEWSQREGGRGASVIPDALLADILEEEATQSTSNSKKLKKAVTQDEIDKLFNP